MSAEHANGTPPGAFRKSIVSSENSMEHLRKNSLEKKIRFTSPSEFVLQSGGTRVIEKILIANNGIAAVKCMRSLRKWAYATFRNSEALLFVCMATPEDVQANAEYIKMANKTVMVPGGSNVNNYANVELILQTAVTNEVDAVWAGWGHASENPQLPEALSKHNIAFLGPNHYAMWALGDKVASTILAESANVPTLPWSGSNIRLSMPVTDNNKSSTARRTVSVHNVPTSNSLSNMQSKTDYSPAQPIHFYLDGSQSNIFTGLSAHSGAQINSKLIVQGQYHETMRNFPPTNLISEDLYRAACVTDVVDCQARADLIGYPVMIKAAEGGGGKGIRRATNPAELARFFPQVQTEVPGSPIFLMKCAQNARHLEVQLLADEYGQAISLFGRDCSVQRRHQKIIEEAPIVVAPKETIEAMERAAVRLAKLVGYVSAGTVEYLYDPCTDQFFFLELNPRLQVEHPCTEVVAEVNLPACQLQIAMGIPLNRIKDIRELYRQPAWEDSAIPFDEAEHMRRSPSCYVIAARITSEDPDEGFKPRPGDVQELNFKSSQSVWGYFSVGSAGGIHEFADSQFGHCFSAAETREQARENLALALKELSIRGDFRTTVEYLIKIMESDAFMNHKIDTDWLDMRIAQKDQVEKPDLLLGVVCTALHIADRCLRQLNRNYELHLERGQFLPTNTLTNNVDVTLVSDYTKFTVTVVRTGPSTFHLISNGSLLGVEAHRMSSDGLLICHELASYMTYCHEDAQGYRTVINNRTMAFSKETDPSVLRSQSTGKLLQFTVPDGAHVCANEVYALVEVMKLVLELRVPASGLISLKRIPGASLEPGTELARLHLDDPTQVKSLQLYTGSLILPCGSHASHSSCNTPRRPSTQVEWLTQCGAISGYLSSFNLLDSPDLVPDVSKRHESLEESVSSVSERCTSTDCNGATSSSNQNGSACGGGSVFSPTGSDRLSQSTTTLTGLTGAGKLHHNFARLLASLEQVLLGYALPEPFFTPWLSQSLDQLMKFLHDPRLPLLELQDTIAHLAGRLPPAMERELRAQVKLYAGQITSVMANFPSSQILCLVDNHMARLKRAQLNSTDAANAEVVKFQQTVERLVDMAQRYRQGLRGHTIHVLSQLLLGYVVVERHFQHGQHDKCTRQLLARCNYPGIWTSDPPYSNSCGDGIDLGPDYENDCLEETYPIAPESLPSALQNLVQPKTISDIVAVIFSHRQLTTKNSMLVRLIGLLTERRELCASCDLKLILKALAELGATGSSKVALSARQLLISMQTPSYEIRRNQVESIFLSAVDTFGHQFHPELLYKLITSETVVFDILSDFFYHPNPTVASVALEVYIRRSYTAYELTSVQHIQLPNGASFVAFRFVLPMAQSLRSLQSASHESAHYHALVNRTTDKQEAGCTSLAPTNTNMNQEQSSLATVAAFLNDHHPISNRPDGEQKSTSMHSRTVSSVDANLSTTGSMGTIADMRTLVNGDTIRPVGDRMGGMAAFQSLEQFEQCFDEVIALFVAACTEAKTIQSSLSEPSLFNFGRVSLTESDSRTVADSCKTGTRFPPLVTFQDPPYHTSNPAEEPIHTLNIALQHSSDWSDTNTPSVDGTLFHHQHQHHNRHQTLTERASDNCLKQNLSPSNGQQSTAGATVGLRARNETDDVAQLEAFCARHTDQLLSVGIRRITFLIIKTREFPKCYTFRARDKYREDRVYRHLEPALAFQLELNRMRNYELEQLPCLNRRMHLYLAKSKTLIGRTTIDYRFFVRCIIRHADLLSREASFEFLQSEAERTLLEAMDALELAHTHPDAGYTMGNHIFLNFAPILLLEDINHLKSTIRKTVLRYARRFIRLRVSHAEVKLHIRFQPSEPVVSVRIFLHDEEGYNLGLDVYREVLHPNTGEVLLWSMSSPRGPLHGHHAALPHENKDHLQLKRFQARKFNTTYVYDYPKLFEQALHGFWRNYLPPEDHLCDPNAGLKPTAVVAAAAAAAAQVAADRAVKPGESISSSCLSGMRVSYASTSSTATLTGLGTNLVRDEVILSSTELALDKNNQLRPVSRIPGSNTIGMVVWHMFLRTPDTPTGREVIVIANDATHKAGSFGPAEDLTFHRASQLARYLGLPRIYLASNTGARIRVADEVKSVFRVAWLDPAHPEKGYAYLYLTPDDYQRLNAMEAVNCEPIEEYGEIRYKIVDIVGKDHDMSVENLRGSAMIAGETSIAYDDIFTITIVTNRAIGIGAYLARLGQRIIQVKNSHIILTGAMALNKLLGREVYTSNSQLGGVQVMANNGVSHLVASDELLALQQTLEWLSYVPARRDLPVPVLYRPVPVRRNLTGESPPSDYVVVSAGGNTVGFGASGGFAGVSKELTDQLSFDPIDRLVDYVPSRDRPNDDPRWLFTGVLASQINQINDPPPKSVSSTPSSTSSTTVRPTQVSFGYEDLTKTGDHWLSGFFDWGTWRETLTTWAAGVVVGRARLGGIPCGAITAETRSVTCRVPADPANLSTEAQVVNQAGQVWYPDSAYKTAQAIADFARERIPLFIFASWRGFSGGMKDMYDQVLKFGSMIIDALRRYPEPVFVYLPPQSQLRGGAWVVVDPAINPDRMEMYADPIACRAGVLEPEGTVEIKYRKPDLIETMRRVDEQCNRLLAEIDQLQTGRPIPSTDQTSSDASLSMNERIRQLQMALEARQKELRPYYHQVACTFADLHDTPGRLQSRGLVHGLVEWPKSRTFFYARLRRRLLEMHAIRLINSTTCGTPMDDVMTMPISTHLVEYLSHLTRIPALPVRARTASEATEDEASSRWVEQHQWNGDTTPDQMKSGGDPDTPSSPTRSCTENVGKSERCDSVDPSNHYPSADEIACGVPKIGVQYSSGFARDLAILRQWFIQAHTSVGRVGTEEASVPNGSSTKLSGDLSDAKNSSSTSATTKKGRKSSRPKPHRSLATRSPKNGDPVRTDLISGGSVSISPEAAERAWSDDHMGVGAWLAQQLGCTQFYHVPKLADLVKKEGPTNTNALTDDENLVDGTSVVHEKAPVTFIGAQIEALKRKHMFERFQSTLSASTDKTKELVTMLHQILSPTECAHLVQLLTATTTTAITHDHGVG